MKPEGHWQRVFTLAYINSLRGIIVTLIEPAMTRPGAAKALFTLLQSALSEAERFNRLYPKERPLGADDFIWVLELKAELLRQFGRAELELPE